MTTAILQALGAVCLAAAAALAVRAEGAIDVTFVKPELFVDAGLVGHDREQTLRRLREEFRQLAKKLPDGQSMTVEVLDVDLAGDLDPTSRGISQRVLRGRADIPRIHLVYTLAADGKLLRSGDEWIEDLSYLELRARLPDTQALAFERRMLADWFRERILGAAAAAK